MVAQMILVHLVGVRIPAGEHWVNTKGCGIGWVNTKDCGIGGQHQRLWNRLIFWVNTKDCGIG